MLEIIFSICFPPHADFIFFLLFGVEKEYLSLSQLFDTLLEATLYYLHNIDIIAQISQT